MPVENKDLRFLENVCGKDLMHDMRLSTVWWMRTGRCEAQSGRLNHMLDVLPDKDSGTVM